MDDHLNPRSRALLDRARAAREPTADDEARVRARIAAAIAAGAAGTAGGAASAAGATGAASGSAGAAAVTGGGGGWIAGVVAVLTVGGLAAGGVALNLGGAGEGSGGAEVEITEGSRTGAPDDGAAASDPAGESRPLGGASTGPEPQLPLDGPESEEAPADELDDGDEADVEADRRVRDPDRRRSRRGRGSFGGGAARPKRADRPADLAAEVALLRDADAELQAGDAVRALALIRIHARRFPDSQLWAERDATRILALCALDRVDEARRRARDWMARAPDSPLRASVRSSCAYR